MLRTLLVCALLLLGAAARADSDKHLLWAVHGKTNTLYLFGSVHYLRATDALPEALDRAYRDAAQLVMEIDTDDMDGAANAKLTRLSRLPAGQRLQKALGKALFQTFSATVRSFGGDPARFAKLRPWAAALDLEALQMKTLGFGAGVEEQLTTRAQADRKEITGLETFEAHFNVLAGMSSTTERQFLVQTIDEARQAGPLLEELMSAWRAGDVQPLERHLDQVLNDYPKVYRPLILERNRHWIPQLETMLTDSKNYLVVVGALHLVGRDGVVTLLQEQGYDVVQQ